MLMETEEGCTGRGTVVVACKAKRRAQGEQGWDDS